MSRVETDVSRVEINIYQIYQVTVIRNEIYRRVLFMDFQQAYFSEGHPKTSPKKKR